MKEKRENYIKPLSYVIETEQPLMSGSGSTGSIGINPNPEYKPGPQEARRNEFEDDWEEDDWAE